MTPIMEKQLDVLIILLGVLAGDVCRRAVRDEFEGAEKLVTATDLALQAFNDLIDERQKRDAETEAWLAGER